MYLSVSSEVQPEFREYERLSTTVLNAYLQPVIDRYLGDFAAGVGAGRAAGRARHQPVGRRADVGCARAPRADPHRAVGAGGRRGRRDPHGATLRRAGRDLARHGRHQRRRRADARLHRRHDLQQMDRGLSGAARLARHQRGRRRRRLDRLVRPRRPDEGRAAERGRAAGPGLLRPRRRRRPPSPTPIWCSAGCRRAACSAATWRSTQTLARDAIAPLAERLGFSVERTAHGMLGIVVANMVRAIRSVSVERGHDPRAFALLPFGGAGPLHATDVAKSLGITRCLVPFAPGILCAQGLIVSDLRETFVRTAVTPLDEAGMADVAARIGELKQQADAWFDAEGVAPASRSIDIVLDTRYVGQNFELAIGAAARPIPLPAADAIAQRFFAEHERAYGFHNPADRIEIVNFRLLAVGQIAPARGAARRAAQVRQGRARVAPKGLVHGRRRAGHAGLRPRHAAARRHDHGPGGDRAARFHHAAVSRATAPTVDPHLNLDGRDLHMSIDPITLEIISNGLQVDRRRDLHRADEERLLDQHQGAPRPLDRDHRSGRAADRAGGELAGDSPRLDDGPDEHAARQDAAVRACARATSSSPTIRMWPAARTCPTSTWRCRCSPTAGSSASCATSRIMPTSAASRRAAWRAAPRSTRKARASR